MRDKMLEYLFIIVIFILLLSKFKTCRTTSYSVEYDYSYNSKPTINTFICSKDNILSLYSRIDFPHVNNVLEFLHGHLRKASKIADMYEIYEGDESLPILCVIIEGGHKKGTIGIVRYYR